MNESIPRIYEEQRAHDSNPMEQHLGERAASSGATTVESLIQTLVEVEDERLRPVRNITKGSNSPMTNVSEAILIQAQHRRKQQFENTQPQAILSLDELDELEQR